MEPATANLRVLFINEFFWPDVCASSAVLSDHLPRIAALRPNWRLTVLAGDRAWDRPEVRWAQEEQWGRIRIVRVPRPASGRNLVRRAMGFAGFHLGVMRAGRKIDRPDVIVTSTAPPLGGRLGAKLARHFRCPYLYKVLDLYPDCADVLGVIRERGLISRAWRRADVGVMTRAAAVVPISNGIRDRILRTRPVAQDAVHVIHDGFDFQRVQPGPRDRNLFRAECGLGGRFVVQYAGNMGLSHPFGTILAAARQLRPDPRFAFQFIGAGPGRATLEAARVAMPECVQLLEYQPAARLGDVLGCSDVSLISQDARMAELSLPYKFYGILAAGRPAIFVGPASSEIVGHFRTAGCGLHVEQGDVAALVAALIRLADDAILRERMGSAARELFENRFRSDLAAQAWVSIIEDASRRRPDL